MKPMIPTVAIHADASTEIGSGHVMRTLELARRLRDAEYRVVYWCRSLAGHLMELIHQEGFEVLAFAKAEEALALVDEGMRQTSPFLLVIDHYGIDVAIEREIKARYGVLLLCYDDGFAPHAGDVVVNPNIYATEEAYQGKVAEGTTLLTGVAYSAIRSEFYRAKGLPPEGHPRPRLLVTLGGSDPHNVTLKVLQGLAGYDHPLDVEVVVGPSNTHRPSLQAQAKCLPSCQLRDAVSDMAALMHGADIAITAAGQTTLEALFMELPTVNIQIADNQQKIADYLHREALSRSLPPDFTPKQLRENVEALLLETTMMKERLMHVSQKIATGSIVDGIRCLVFRHATMTPTVPEDRDALFTLANDPQVRDNSLTTQPIPYETHRTWFAQMMADPSQHLYTLKSATGAFMGQCRFDCRHEGVGVMSISVIPEARGCRVASLIITRAVAQFFETFPESTVEAVIKPSNTPSLKSFERVGFQRVDEDTDKVVFHLTRGMYENCHH